MEIDFRIMSLMRDILKLSQHSHHTFRFSSCDDLVATSFGQLALKQGLIVKLNETIKMRVQRGWRTETTTSRYQVTDKGLKLLQAESCNHPINHRHYDYCAICTMIIN